MIFNRLPAPLRASTRRVSQALGLPYWFPHAPLALLVALGGFLLLDGDFGQTWHRYLDEFAHGSFSLGPRLLPPLLLGVGMLTMALGLLLRSRVAWTMALLLVGTAAVSTRFGSHAGGFALLGYFVALLAALLIAWRHFDRSSVAASTLFALTSVAMLLMYATFGSYYLGTSYKPPITDLVTALYYAMVTMSTVGYGDIVPQSAEAKLFTVSIIVLGVAVFATSLTAVIAPMVSRSLLRIVDRKGKTMTREDHFVVVGSTPLADNTWRELARRGCPVTRILREAPGGDADDETDTVIGDASRTDVLKQAGADRATAVLAMMADDSENAFIVLAVKELGGGAQTIAAVNDSRHLSRIKLVQPDVVIAPQVLGAELAAMLLSGETVTPEFVMQRVFQREVPAAATSPGSAPPASGKPRE
ncbi:MAG TPA: voltage-gated potassium channel protein [Caldimonas sp.]|nr:voltage-gated potassium channel protein [Caldimonas sp.]